MLKADEIFKMKEKLEKLLTALQGERVHYIEYGDGKSSYWAHIRCYYTPTKDGMQYAIKQVFSGIEGGGYITLSKENAINKLLDLVLSITRDSGLSWYMKNFIKTPDLDWYAMNNLGELVEDVG